MAEIVGTVASAITLAGLFKLCIEAFDIIHTAQNQALDLKKLTLKLNIEKCRLYVWGQGMGLTTLSETGKQGPLDLCPYPELIHETLKLVIGLFNDSEKLKEKYGCISAQSDDVTGTPAAQVFVLHQLNASFDNFKIKSNVRNKQNTLAKKSYWIIRDRKKFERLIGEAKSFVDGLQDITKDLQSPEYQQDMMSSRIRDINDARTLDWVSEVCEVNYPALSDAASLKADTITDVSTFHVVQQWKKTVDPLDRDDDSVGSSVETAIAALEDLTVTELKHKFSTYLLRIREERMRKSSLTPPVNLRSEDQDSSSTAATDSSAKPPTVMDSSKVMIDARRWGKILENSIENHAKEPVLTGKDWETNETIIKEMMSTRLDKDFEDELDAIEEWFRVLSDAERSAAFLVLSKVLSLDQVRLFVHLQNRALSKISDGANTTEVENILPSENTGTSTSEQAQPDTLTPADMLPDQVKIPSKWSPTSQKPDFEVRIKNSFNEFAQVQKEGRAEKDAARTARKVQEIEELKKFSKDFLPLPMVTEPLVGKSIITKAKSTEPLRRPAFQSEAFG